MTKKETGTCSHQGNKLYIYTLYCCIIFEMLPATVGPWCFHINVFSLMLFLETCTPVEKQIQLHKINGLYRPSNKMWLNLEQTIIYPVRPLGIITLIM